MVLIQIYRDGTDYISWHSDKEAIPNGLNTIGSLSLGANRRFLMRPVEGDGEKLEFPLGGGALLVMTGTTQRYVITHKRTNHLNLKFFFCLLKTDIGNIQCQKNRQL